MSTISQRIKEALALRNLKQSDLVELTGIGKSSISTYISGAYEPKQKNIYKIAQALNVDESWLMGNDVPMEKNNSFNNNLSKNEKELLSDFNKLNDIGKKEASKRVKELTQIKEYTYEEPKTLQDLKPTVLAAHDDNLTDDEKAEADRRILEAINKMQK